MGFLDELSKKISDVGYKAVDKTMGTSGLSKLNSMIAEEEKRLDALYIQIGQLYCQLHREDYEDEFIDLMGPVFECQVRIADCHDQIRQVKGILVCTKCGAELAKGSAFCNACGERVATPPVATPPTAYAPSGTVCIGCGTPLEAGTRFCTNCGMPMTNDSAPEITADSLSAAPVAGATTGGGTSGAYSVKTEPAYGGFVSAPAPVPAPAAYSVKTEPAYGGFAAQPAPAPDPVPAPVPAPEEAKGFSVKTTPAPFESPADAVKTCSRCGSIMTADKMFCTDCGTKL